MPIGDVATTSQLWQLIGRRPSSDLDVSYDGCRFTQMKCMPKKEQPAEKRKRLAGSQGTGVSGSPGHRCLMRLAAATVVPLLFFAMLELGLRVAGYGYSTSYFVPSKIDGQEFLVPNHRFAYRFFPRALARVPLPMRMLADKPNNSYRIFLFGESAAYGDPDPA